jgi:starvation-inducible outer membrane lipoprotein
MYEVTNMKKISVLILISVLLSACVSSPAPSAGFTCTHVQPVESIIAGEQMIQFVCSRWERQADKKEPQPYGIKYKNMG